MGKKKLPYFYISTSQNKQMSLDLGLKWYKRYTRSFLHLSVTLSQTVKVKKCYFFTSSKEWFLGKVFELILCLSVSLQLRFVLLWFTSTWKENYFVKINNIFKWCCQIHSCFKSVSIHWIIWLKWCCTDLPHMQVSFSASLYSNNALIEI